jgi:hypothetical protein
MMAFEMLTEADEGLSADVRARLIWAARQIRRESPEAPVLLRETQAMALRVLRRVETADPELLTLTRALDQLVRCLRALGMLRQVVGGGGGRRPGAWRLPPTRRPPPVRATDDDQDAGTEPAETGGNAT